MEELNAHLRRESGEDSEPEDTGDIMDLPGMKRIERVSDAPAIDEVVGYN
jgi:hypothetical protein